MKLLVSFSALFGRLFGERKERIRSRGRLIRETIVPVSIARDDNKMDEASRRWWSRSVLKHACGNVHMIITIMS